MAKTKPNTQDNKMLTDVELELMTILWKLKEGSVNEVIEHLPKDRPLAYTSVSTILRILEQKDILETRKEGRGHIYIPRLKKTDYEAKTVKHVVERVFDNAPLSLVKQLLASKSLKAEDIAELKQLVAKLESGK